MIRSMTGFGRKEGTLDEDRVAVEIRSVNHRFCEITTHMPSGLLPFEADIRESIKHRVSRGKIDVSITVRRKTGGNNTVHLDRSVAGQYVHVLNQLKREYRLDGDVNLALIAGHRDIMSVTPPDISPQMAHDIIHHMLPKALEQLAAMRRREGRVIAHDLLRRIAVIRTALAVIQRRTPTVIGQYHTRLRARIRQLMGDHPIDEGRIAQEVALYAARCDISEELTRAVCHIDQFKQIIRTGQDAGRTLNFLLQELSREVNTLGTKGNDTEISRHVVAMKSELEKVREQVQNVE